MTDQKLKLTAFKVSQPIGDFYVTKIPYRDLVQCAEANIRRITDNDANKMIGMQRPLSPSRVKEIREYVKTIDATFPNSIILCLSEKYGDIIHITDNGSEKLYNFEILKDKNAFSIIDGQHRLAGFEQFFHENNQFEFDLIATIFMELRMEDQAYIFSTINSKQRIVSKSLVYDLFDLAESRSPDRSAHLITKSLNRDIDSPFYNRIALLGKAPRFENKIIYRPFLNQGSVAGKISELISKNSLEDRDKLLRGDKLDECLDVQKSKLIFRNYFVKNRDDIILAILLIFFDAVKKHFPEEWSHKNTPLSKAVGFGALMLFLVDAYREGYQKKDLSSEFFDNLIKTIRLSYDADNKTLNFNDYSPSGSGERDLYKDLLKWSKLESSNS